MEDKFVKMSEVPRAKIGRPGNKWANRFRKMRETGETLCLCFDDAHQAHVTRSTAQAMAKGMGLRVSTTVITEVGRFTLYIWLV